MRSTRRRDEPWSNCWRTGHVAWLIVNVRLFGASNPLPWQVTNLLAHLATLYAASGRDLEALKTYRRFMELTEGSSQPVIATARKRAASWLGAH